MNLTSVLNIGASGLTAASAGTAVASQNISNSATEGYARRILTLDPVSLSNGGGVRANTAKRVTDQFLEQRGLSARAGSGEADGKVQTLQILDSVLSDEAGGIGPALDAFESALSDFAAQPSDTAARQVLLDRADQLTSAFNQAGDALSSARAEANGRISASVDDVNDKLEQIASLSRDIGDARGKNQDAADLEDRRDQLVRDVAKAIPVTTIEDPSGSFTLLLAGSRTLVDATGTAHRLEATTDPGSGDVRITRTSAGASEDVTSLITSGSIGGTIAARDGALQNAQSSLDQLAYDIAQSYNAVHSAGGGLDGATGRNLFAPPAAVAGAASNFALSSDVAGQPNNLAAASDASSLPGDNRAALALLGLRDAKLASSGTQTAQQAYASLISGAGSSLRTAMDRQTQQGATLDQIDSLRESVSGVSTDEEMISLMRFQRAYQASLRVVETADAMLEELMNLRR